MQLRSGSGRLTTSTSSTLVRVSLLALAVASLTFTFDPAILAGHVAISLIALADTGQWTLTGVCGVGRADFNPR